MDGVFARRTTRRGSPLIVPRIAREMQYRILTPLLEREDLAGWGIRVRA